MKKVLISLAVFAACAFTNKTTPVDDECTYDVQLVSSSAVGANYEWVWKVTNPCPGNGTDGTLQDLSHWCIAATCLTQADLVSAAYSSNGTSWSSLSANIGVDPSQSCYTAPVLKFDRGISGSQPVYFKLVVNKAFAVGTSTGVFKSGRRTGCYIADIPGPSCSTGLPDPR